MGFYVFGYCLAIFVLLMVSVGNIMDSTTANSRKLWSRIALFSPVWPLILIYWLALAANVLWVLADLRTLVKDFKNYRKL